MAVSKLDLLCPTSPENRADQGPRLAESQKTSTGASAGEQLHAGLERLAGAFRHLDVGLDPDIHALRCFQRHPDRPCFSQGLLDEVMDLQRTLKVLLSGVTAAQMPFRYLVWGSSLPGIYNLGGDLEHFCALVRRQDAEGLHAYAKRCVDVCYLNALDLDLPILTVALVQGDALGGGFESVLSNDLIIAEEGTKFGLPEVIFNLFPGMGAYSFLSRKLDPGSARRMIMSGRLYAAEELHEIGIVDILCAKGEGDRALSHYIEQNRHRETLLTALAGVGRRCQPIAYEELIDVAELWVETTLGLSENDLRRMERLVAAQDRRRRRMRDAPAA